MNTLVSPDDLSLFPGAPFDDLWVDIAVASVRSEAGWHIAPVVTETITLDVPQVGRYLVLPSRRVVSVDTVTSTNNVDGWSLLDSGTLYRPLGWATGPVSVTFTHGYEAIPPDLLPVIITRVRSASSPRDSSVASETTGPYSVTYRSSSDYSASLPSRYIASVGVA